MVLIDGLEGCYRQQLTTSYYVLMNFLINLLVSISEIYCLTNHDDEGEGTNIVLLLSLEKRRAAGFLIKA